MKNVSSTIPVMNSYVVGILLVTAATVAWSSAGLFTRLIQLDSWTTLLIVFIAVANYLRKTSGKSYTDNVED